MIAWALATRGDYDPDLMAFVSRRSMELMRAFTGQHIATVLWAIATVSYKDFGRQKQRTNRTLPK
eukprot:889328-Amphidinium_carterae.1